MNFLEIGFNSKKAISVEMISVSTRLHVVLLPVAFLMAFARPGYPIAKKVSTLLGNKVLFSCPFDGNVTKMSWVFNSKLQIAALRCDLNEMALISNNSRIIIQNATCNTFKNEMNLQIESVQLADDGNYTCEILDQRGVHRLAFSFAVTVPPAISFSTDNKPNNTMMAICTASNGKPAAEITWYPNNLGNFSINITHHSNRTVTVQSKYHISIHHFSEEIICAVNHPAFDGIKNYTIHQNGPASYDSQLSPKILFLLYLIAGVLAACLCLLAVVAFTVRCFNLQIETAFRNCCISRSSQEMSQSNGPFIQMENFIYDSFQPQKPRN